MLSTLRHFSAKTGCWKQKNIWMKLIFTNNTKYSNNVKLKINFLPKATCFMSGFALTVCLKKNSVVFCDKKLKKFEINEVAIRQKIDWLQIWNLLKTEIWLILASILATFFAAYLNVKIPLCLGQFINVISTIIRNSEPFEISRFRGPSIKLIILYASQALCTFTYIAFLAKLGENLSVKLKTQLFSSIIRQDIEFFDSVRTSTLVDCLTNDVQEFKSTLKQVISQGIRNVAQITGGVVTLFILSPLMTSAVVFIVPIVILIGSTFGSILRTISNEAQNENVKASTQFEESISNIRTVRAFANEQFECSKFENTLERSKNLNTLLGYGIGVFQAGTNLFLNSIVLGTLCLGATLMSTSQLTPGDLMSFLVSTQTIQRSFAQLSLLFGHFIKGKEALRRILYYSNLSPKISLSDGIEINENAFIPTIEFESVSFAYPTRPKQSILNNLNLFIPPGKTVAIVGTSGNGKTTIANLIERFYDVNNGTIFISGTDIKNLSPNWLRGSKIGIINQEPILFAQTIRENIRYGKTSATDDEVYEAAKNANAHEFILNFPDGYDTILGERGVTISGGQKQRIAIARALIKNPSILILDEATSALDAESERIVQKTLDEVGKSKTVVIIAHRLSTIENADIIIVLKRGQIVETGTHKELLAKKGLYWELMNQPGLS